jgi:hypothetical protein
VQCRNWAEWLIGCRKTWFIFGHISHVRSGLGQSTGSTGFRAGFAYHFDPPRPARGWQALILEKHQAVKKAFVDTCNFPQDAKKPLA